MQKTLNGGKIRKYDENNVFFENKTIHFLKLNLYQFEKAVVAGHLEVIKFKWKIDFRFEV